MYKHKHYTHIYLLFLILLILSIIFLSDQQFYSQETPKEEKVVSSFCAQNSTEGITLSWKADKSVDGYYIYKGKNKIKTIKNNKINTFTDTTAIKNGHKYIYRISSYSKNDGHYEENKISSPLLHYYLRPGNIKSAIITDSKVNIDIQPNRKCSGYEIECSLNPDFKKATKYKTSKTSVITNAISLKKDYYFRIRTYLTFKKNTYYSVWTDSFKIISFNSDWKYAQNSKIHSASIVLYYSNATSHKGKTICVNAGHGTNGGESKSTLCHPDGSPKVTDGTASKGSIKTTAIATGMNFNDGTPERTANLAIAKALKNKLLKAGYDVLMIRETNDVQLDNIARTVLANNNADCHISIHYDSTSCDKGAFYTGVPRISSYRKMEPVASNWKKHEALGSSLISGIKSSGIKIYQTGRMEVDLTQTSYSTIASTDIELGDRNSKRSTQTIDTIAEGLCNGVNLFLKNK